MSDIQVTDLEAEEEVREKSFTVKEGGLTICKLKLANGHEVFGVAKASPGVDFSSAVGEVNAYRNALKKVKELETYARRKVGLDPSWWHGFKLRIVGAS